MAISVSSSSAAASLSVTKFDLRAYILRRVWHSVMYLTWYVLSIGPMFWQWHHAQMQSEPSFIEFFYRPLAYACKVPIINDVVNAYINLWIL